MAITNTDRRWYNLAMKIAEDSEARSKHGCVIVSSGCVLSLAANRAFMTHPTSERYERRSIHAEQRAINRCSGIAGGATLYSARAHFNRTSRPCEMCEELIKWAMIRRVVYHDGNDLKEEKYV